MKGVDNKAKSIVYGSDYIILLECDSLSQDVITQAQRDGSVSLEGGALDGYRSILVSQIIDVIAKDTPTSVVRREVDMLTAIKSCIW